jgi:hypothetical protein
MIKLKDLIICESLDDPYGWKNTFSTEEIDYEDEESGETYKKDVMSPVQIIKFVTDSGRKYLWYAKQSRYDDTAWEVAFGVEGEKDHRGTTQLDIGITGRGEAFRIFATVLEISNSFIEWDEDGDEISTIIFTAKGENRAALYIKRLVPRIEKFEMTDSRDVHGETEITMHRTSA